MLTLMAVTIFLVWPRSPDTDIDFEAANRQSQQEALEESSQYVEEWVPWADPDSGEVTAIDSMEGSAYVTTFQQEDAESSDFNIRCIIITDALTGEQTFIQAP